MRLAEDECWARLIGARKGVLGTVHEQRAVDAVPVVFAIDDRRIIIPVDTVKPKSGGRLRRLVNLEHHPRCVLLVDDYDEDWSQLWWVRVHGHAEEVAPTEQAVALLAARYPQYRAAGTVVGTIVVTPDAIAGWRSGGSS